MTIENVNHAEEDQFIELLSLNPLTLAKSLVLFVTTMAPVLNCRIAGS